MVEYLVDLSAAAAAIRAGYSEKGAAVQGSRLLSDVNVQAAIGKLKESRLIRTEITQDRVLNELALLAFSDVTHYTIDDDGQIKLAEGAPATAMRAVSSIKRKIRTDKDGNVEREVELKLWDKPGPLKLAGRHVGLFPAKDKAQLEAEASALLESMIKKAREQQAANAAGAAPPAVQDERKMIDVGEAQGGSDAGK